MSVTAEPTSSSLTAVLRSVLAGLQRASGAELAALFLYDEHTRTYYAPVTVGQGEEGLGESVADLSAQLARYLADREEGKAPDELSVPHYGSTVWLTITRRPLVARDAAAEIDSTFVRRHHVRSTLGLPLLAGDQLLGIVYLNYRSSPATDGGAPPLDDERVVQLERRAAAAAAKIQATLASVERLALEITSRLSALLTTPVGDGATDGAALRRRLSIALADLLQATGDAHAAAVYDATPHRDRMELVTAHAPVAMPPRVDLPEDPSSWSAAMEAALRVGVNEAGLVPAAITALGRPEEPDGYLAVLSRDPLAAVRWAPATRVMLEAAARLVGGALAGRRLIAGLANANRLLGALGDLTNAMLRPGASREEVISAVAVHLTDAAVPEFDFHFAAVYLIAEASDRTMLVRMAAGAATTDAIDAAQVRDGQGVARVPRWVLQQERPLTRQDVLVYVARRRQVVVVGPAGRDVEPQEVITGAIPEPARWISVPVVRSDGSTVTTVPACLIGEPEPGVEWADMVGGAEGVDGQSPFTLAGDIFERSGHGELIRIFLPFGRDSRGRATGVLEVGYHRSFDRRPDWGQVEALRATAAQVAAAVETARLYEEARHHAEQLELSADVSEAIASSIDLEQTLRLVARNLVRLVDASLCQIALYEEGGEGWFGAAASDQEDLWRRQHGERGEGGERSFLFDVLERGGPLLIEDAEASSLVPPAYVRAFGVRSLLVLPLVADGQPIGAAVLAHREKPRAFTAEEVQRAQGLAHQAAVAIKNARLHALAEEERHIQKDFVLIGMGQWGQRAYQHLQTLKQFFNFRVHVVEQDSPEARARLAALEEEVHAHGDMFYWDSPASPARDQLAHELEASAYAITYIATPAPTHLATLARYYDLSNVILIEKPLGASPEAYREFLESAPGGVELVAADHYYFKLEVRLLQQLLTQERTLRDFLESVEEIQVEILERQPLTGAAADIGVVADLIPHAFAIVSLFTPIDRIELDEAAPLLIGRHEGMTGQRESYARMNATFRYHGRSVRLVIDVGKGVEDAKWIKLCGESRLSGRRPYYKFDFGNGEAIDGTQSTVRAAVRRIREPGVPDNAHLTMLRHVIERQRPAVGILSIREAIRANQRVQQLEALAGDLLARHEWTPYALGARPVFPQHDVVSVPAVG